VVGDVAGDEVDDPAEGGRPVQGGAGALDHLDALDGVGGKEIPVDAAAVALVGRDAVDEQQDARAQALHVSGRAADVGLAVQELYAGRAVDGFVDRVDGAPGDGRIGHQRDAGDDVLERLLSFAGGDDDRSQVLDGPQSEIHSRGVVGCDVYRYGLRLKAEGRCLERDRSRGHHLETIGSG